MWLREQSWYRYKVAENKWYTAPYRGEQFGSYGTLNNSTFYDPKLKLAVRMTHSYGSPVNVLIMRLAPEELALNPIDYPDGTGCDESKAGSICSTPA